jgi:hypothetical protein
MVEDRLNQVLGLLVQRWSVNRPVCNYTLFGGVTITEVDLLALSKGTELIWFPVLRRCVFEVQID